MKFETKYATSLVKWYQKNKRDLPWRETGNPYDVWLSEIMLQQTRVEFVKDRFIQFKKALPTIQSLSKCDDDKLMKLWEGMGYYSRARNLKKCAIELVDNHNGKLPNDPMLLKKLPGIGPYTSGAIASIAYEVPVSAVDGNVLRILARLFEDKRDIRNTETRVSYETVLNEFLESNYKVQIKKNTNFVSQFNQALMELGALVCVPNGEPNCAKCPWKNYCKAHLNNSSDKIPYRSSLKERKIVERTVLVIRDGNRFLIHKRPSKGLLADLYEFIGFDKKLNKIEIIKEVETLGFEPLKIKKLPDSKHIFSHIEWRMENYEVFVENVSSLKLRNSKLLTKKELQSFAIPSAFKSIVNWYGLHD